MPAAEQSVPFRWDLITPDQLGSLLAGTKPPDLWFLDDLVACAGKVVARSGNGDLVFVGRSLDPMFDLLGGALADTRNKQALRRLPLSFQRPGTRTGRRWALDQAGDACQGCGAASPDGAGLKCHERWAYDDERGAQILTGVEIHCARCDSATHPGFTGVLGGPEAVAQAMEWLCEVNGWSAAEAAAHRREAWQAWRQRSLRLEWSQDRSGWGAPVVLPADGKGPHRWKDAGVVVTRRG